MKTKKLKPVIGIKSLFKTLMMFALSNGLYAQVQNNQELYIGDYGEVHLKGETLYFGLPPAFTMTSRTEDTYGVLSFSATANYDGVSDDHHVNGYTRTYGTSLFIAPIGNGTVYAPAAVTPSNSSGVDAAYYSANPATIGTALGGNVAEISTVEYWEINGTTSAIISLTWRPSSLIASLTTELEDLTILGFDGSEWVEIPSVFDATSIVPLVGASTLTEGSITSISAVDLNDFTEFTIGAKSCFPVVVSSMNVKTYNGSWSPSAPTIEDPVVIQSPFTGSFSAYSVVLNADITLSNTDYIEVVDEFTGSGTVKMSPNASLVQRNSGASAPKIELTKITRDMRRFDYQFLSSPIDSSVDFFAQILNKNNVAVDGNFGVQANSAFYQLRTFNAAGLSAIDATAANTPIGRGFSATVRSQAPYSLSTTTGAWYTEKKSIHIKTIGEANNGNVPVTIPGGGWVRVGNPYPSAINGEKLLKAMGDNVEQTLYYWTYNSPRQFYPNNSLNYTNADFATWNLSGGVTPCATCNVPNGIIESMNSVLVEGKNPISTVFDITNCMRETTGNDNFFRMSGPTSDKFWINLIGTSNSFSQILIAYDEKASSGYDNGYDSPKLGNSTSSYLGSTIDGKNYVIQTKGMFNDNDVVPLQVNKNIEENLSFTLDSTEGIFSTDDVNIYIHDKDLGIYHNLKVSPYDFVQSEVENSDRFEVVYYSQVLSNPDYTTSNAIALIFKQVFKVQSSSSIQKINIFDIAGRLVETYDAKGQTLFTVPFNHAHGAYIAKIELANGTTVTSKLINQ